ncbi:uncharacterized protein LOC133477457 [Phyllopteryx taeniolatus]|uniref:uncharacterized protein LOC133477457 n=1 Tax=Phyllopteryx taeniolatus TaxID=161469 RepID=UPI002AD3427F|nr:uncharacterized protein LOC133477457 [Phyllopteryx taeniolatus]
MSEGQFGSISGPRNLQVVNMKHPLGYCLPRMTGAMSLDKEQSDQEKTKRLKLLEEQVQDVQTLGSHWDNNIPFVAKHIKASGKKVEPTHGQKDKSKKKQTPTDEEIKANLRKKLEAFNQMSKNKSHAQPNPYSDTQCEPVGMKICTSKCETMVLSRKRVECPLQVGDEILHKYLGVLYTSEGKMEREIKRWIGAASAVMQTLYWYVVVKELSRKAKLSIYRSMYIPTLTYGCELWVVTERTRSRIHAAEMSFLRRVSGLSLRDRVRSSVMRWALLVGGASMLSDGGGGGGAGEACWVEGVGLGVVRALWSGSGPPWVMRGRCRPPGWVPCWTSWLTRPLPCEGGSPFLDVPAQQLRTPVD